MDIELLHYLQKSFKLPDLQIVNEINSGMQTKNWIVISNGFKFVLKQHRTNNISEIEKVNQAVRMFECKLPVVSALVIEEQSVVEFEDNAYSLYLYKDGKIFNRGSVSICALVNSAKFLAQLHFYGQKKYIDIDLPCANTDLRKYFSEDLNHLKQIVETKRAQALLDSQAWSLIELQEQLALNYQIPSYYHLQPNHFTHGDFHDQNLIFDDYGNINAVIDFEEAKYGFRLVEVVRSMLIMCLGGGYNKLNLMQAVTYLRTYYSCYQFSREELIEAIDFVYTKRLYSLWALKQIYLHNNRKVEKLLPETYTHLISLSQNLPLYKKIFIKEVFG